jgi:hypothetical protein
MFTGNGSAIDITSMTFRTSKQTIGKGCFNECSAKTGGAVWFRGLLLMIRLILSTQCSASGCGSFGVLVGRQPENETGIFGGISGGPASIYVQPQDETLPLSPPLPPPPLLLPVPVSVSVSMTSHNSSHCCVAARGSAFFFLQYHSVKVMQQSRGTESLGPFRETYGKKRGRHLPLEFSSAENSGSLFGSL